MTMCDLRHMVSNGEDMDEIYCYRNYILHAHIDFPLGSMRLFPQKEDGYDYIPYLKALKKAECSDLLTIEAMSYREFFQEAVLSNMYLRSLLKTENC